MQTEEKYAALLQELGELIAAKNNRLMMISFEADTLRKRLADAEQQLAEAKQKIDDLTF